MARLFGERDLGVERRPLRARLAALEAEAHLQARRTMVAELAVDRHVPGAALRVAEFGRAVVEHFEVVVAGQARIAVGARDAHLVLGLGIVRRELGQADRPVGEVGPLELAVVCQRLELVLLKAQRSAGPVRGGAAHRLARPRRQVGEVGCDAPVAGGRALIEPGELIERLPLVLDERLRRFALARLEQHDLDALLAQFVG